VASKEKNNNTVVYGVLHVISLVTSIGNNLSLTVVAIFLKNTVIGKAKALCETDNQGNCYEHSAKPN
jgi:hypothetical protein